MTPLEDFERASVIASCANPLPGRILSQYGNRIIRISDHQVVKWGPDVTKEEFENQRLANKLVDSRKVRIPRVYDFFCDERGWGYFVMEFIDGKVIDPLEDANSIRRVANVLNYFSTLQYNIPGSLYGGACRGLLFPETEDLVFDSLDGMEKWFNSRLFAHNPKLTLRDHKLVLCHLDIAPRNILWQEDGSLCLIDWASAGFYPRLFEFCVQWIFDGKDGKFNSLLLKSMNPLLDQEMAQREPILCAWRNIQKYPFQNKSSIPCQIVSEYPADSKPEPAHPMPEYPPDWCEQGQHEYSTPARPTCVAPSSSAVEGRKQKQVYNRVVRFFGAMFSPHATPSKAT